MKQWQIIALLCLFGACSTFSATAQESMPLEGILVQGTSDGAAIIEGLAIRLEILRSDGRVDERFNTLTLADGRFRFESIPYRTNALYLLSTDWAGIAQQNLPFKIEDYSEPIQFPVYETTTDLSQVVANQGNLRVGYERDLGLEILLELHYVNLGERVILGNEAGTFTVELPVGAFGIAPEQPPGDVQRYIAVEEIGGLSIPGLQDQQPLVPGWPNVLRASFFVPYDDGAVLDMRLPFSLTNMAVFVSQDTAVLESDLLTDSGEQETSSGQRYSLYTQTTPLSAGQPFIFSLQGQPIAANPPMPLSTRDDSASLSLLVAAIAGFVLLFGTVLSALWWSRRQQTTNQP